MDLKGIIAIAGMPGLYKVIAQAKSGFIVESVADSKRMPVSANQRISALDEISVYTKEEDVPLTTVLKNIKEAYGDNVTIAKNADNKALFDFFEKALPAFDKERVYPSDIKKIANWYGMLKDYVNVSEEEPEIAGEESKESKAIKAVKKTKTATTEKAEPSKVKTESKKGAATKTRKKV